jgi:hypothetical protein
VTTTWYSRSSCRNCRRPIEWLDGIGWLHGELAQYAGETITCNVAHPIECSHRRDAACPLATREATR